MLSLLKTPFLSAGAHAIADILEDSALTGLLVAFNDPAESRFDTRGKRAPRLMARNGCVVQAATRS